MAKSYKVIEAVVMPAGEYWVGDPCYSVPNARWIEWLEAANYMDEPQILVAEIDGKPVLGISTAYGDGEYYDDDHRAYPVDAGLIGVTPVELAEGEPFGTHRVTFHYDFTCRYEDGNIILGNITIDTDPEEEESTCWGCGYAESDCRCEEEQEDEIDD